MTQVFPVTCSVSAVPSFLCPGWDETVWGVPESHHKRPFEPTDKALHHLVIQPGLQRESSRFCCLKGAHPSSSPTSASSSPPASTQPCPGSTQRWLCLLQTPLLQGSSVGTSGPSSTSSARKGAQTGDLGLRVSAFSS